MTGPEFATSLRAIADWYEAHPEMPHPVDISVPLFDGDAKEMTPDLVRALSPCEKEHGAVWVTVRRDFLGLPLSFRLWREAVCEKRVVGRVTKKAVFIPEHEEEVVEWDCHPLLAPEPAEPAPERGFALAPGEALAIAQVVGGEPDADERGAPEDDIPF